VKPRQLDFPRFGGDAAIVALLAATVLVFTTLRANSLAFFAVLIAKANSSTHCRSVMWETGWLINLLTKEMNTPFT
jgi:hypothetical protein